MKNYLLAIILALASFSASACWYNLNGYSDYIDSVNDQKVAIAADITHGYQTSTHFKIKNNNTVDFPLTVTTKLISNQVISDGERGTKPEILRCKLQYAVLSKGNDVLKYDVWKFRDTFPERSALEDRINNYYGKGQHVVQFMPYGDPLYEPDFGSVSPFQFIFQSNDKYYVFDCYGNKSGYVVYRVANSYDPNDTLEGYTAYLEEVQIAKCTINQWVTVAEYNVPTGTIPESEPPKTYFGKNNIMPVGCKEGDVIFIRLYVTDGAWQSGDLNSKCDALIQQVQYQGMTIQSLPDFDYTTLQYGDAPQLGGGWTPATCVAVVYSGKTRPIK